VHASYLTGNDYGNEVFSGRYDACTGLVLLGDGKGEFKVISSALSGFKVDGDGKAIGKLKSALGMELLITTQNLDSLRIFMSNHSQENQRSFQPSRLDAWAELDHENGKKERVEFYYGSGYLSQSTRDIVIPRTVKKIVVHDFKGNQRSIAYSELALSAKAGRSSDHLNK
jgi:hypothetical protein